jgi:hypothetical protein
MCPQNLIGESGVRIVLLDAESPVPVVSVLWPVYNGSDCPAGLPRAILVEIAWYDIYLSPDHTILSDMF